MAFRLARLLELRRRAEDEAEQALGAAIVARAAAEARQVELLGQADAAHEHARTQRRAVVEVAQVEDGVARQRYLARLGAEADRLREQAAAHRDGPLAAAQAEEAAARGRHRDARREREALEKLAAKEEAEERRAAGRREEDAAGDLALAAHARRSRE
jgi:flagellar export protein FliJ